MKQLRLPIIMLVAVLLAASAVFTQVVSVIPAKNALNVPMTTTIQVTFSAAMKTSSFDEATSFLVSGTVSGRHAGLFAFSGGNTVAAFTPAVPFSSGEMVVVDITNKVKTAADAAITPFVYAFTVKVAGSPGTFGANTDYPVGSGSVSVFCSDLDGDGDADIAVTNEASTVSIFMNYDNGSFAPKVDYPTGDYPRSLFISDVDCDGHPDLAIANYNSGTVSILKNNGNGTFSPKVDYPTGTRPSSLFVADLNGDGYGDIAVSNFGSDNVSILMNNGDGTFAPKDDYSSGGQPGSVFLKDLDGDGDADLAVSNAHYTVSILKNNGNGTFAPKMDYPTGGTDFIFIYDMDGDGDGDLAITNFLSSLVSILKNNGDGSFAPEVVYPIGSRLVSVFIGDVDGDGDGDLVVPNYDNSCVSVLKNNGDGTFAPKTDYQDGFGRFPMSIFITDINRDHIGDVVVANWIGGTVSILRGNVFSMEHVVAVVPAKNALNVVTTTTIQATFSAAMKTSSFDDATSFIVSGSVSGRHAGSFAFSGGNTVATFTPTVPFRRGEIVVVDITNKLQAADGATTTPFVYTFTVNVAGSPGTFGAKTDYPAGTNPVGVSTADFDRDGDVDMAVSYENDNTVSIFMNNGDGTFAAKVDYPAGYIPIGLFAADIDRDGDVDMAVVNRGDNTVSIFKNNGDGTFAARVDYPTGMGPFNVFISDLDGDGDGDLAVPNFAGNTVSILKNIGDGTFAPKIDYPVGDRPISLFVSDLDGDGDGDIAVANANGYSVSILNNDGFGSFGPKTDLTDFQWTSLPYSIWIADLDHDGDGDLAVANSSFTVSIFKNNGDGTFGPKTDYMVEGGAIGTSVAIGDLDGDGNPDLAVIDVINPSVAIWKNAGDGTFGSYTKYPVSTPQRLAIADINGDGINDLAVTNYADTVSILKGIALPPAHVVAVVPAKNALSVATTTTVQTTFSAAMQTSSFDAATSFIVSGSVSGRHAGSFAFSGDNTVATFAPVVPFRNGEMVVVDFTGKLTTAAGAASTPFVYTFTVKNVASSGTFEPSIEYPVGSNPCEITAADFDGDGDGDLAVANWGENTFSILKNNGDGTFAPKVDYPAGSCPNSLFASDIDLDGDVDLAVVSNYHENNVSIFKNNGDGTFAPKVDYLTGENPQGVSIGDLDGDGYGDLALANQYDNSVSIFMNKGDGSFAAKVDYSVGALPTGMSIFDLDGDGFPDLAVTNQNDNSVSILINNSDGTFAPHTDYSVGPHPGAYCIGDLDHDGDGDLAVVNRDDNTISILKNNGDGSFAPKVDDAAEELGGVLAVADLDGDGDLDLAVTDYIYQFVLALKNAGDGTFGPYAKYPVSVNPQGIAIADFDGDGINDLAVTNILANTVSILKGTSVSHRIAMDGQWNLISCPFEAVDCSKTILFPSAASPAYGYYNGYVSRESLQCGTGYWLKFTAPDTLDLPGDVIVKDTITVNERWNMIGAISYPVAVNNILSLTEGITFSSFFGYDGHYFVADTLKPGRGYWVKANKAGQFVLDASAPGMSGMKFHVVQCAELPPPPPGREETIDGVRDIPKAFALEQNYPNPFNPTTELHYALPVDAQVRLAIFNLLGQQVAMLVDGVQHAGEQTVRWNAEGCPSGIYIYCLEATGLSDPSKTFRREMKMTLLK